MEVWCHHSREFQSVERCYVNLCLSSNTVVPICNVTTIYKFCHKVFTVFHVAPHTVLPAYGIYWRTLALGCTHRVDGRRERLRTRECHIEVGSDVFIDVEVVVDTQHISLIVLVDIQTVVLVVAERSLCLHVLCTSGYADGMSHARSRPLEQYVLPVGHRIVVGVGSVQTCPVAHLLFGVCLILASCRVVVVSCLVDHFDITLRTYIFRQLGWHLPSVLEVVVECQVAILGALCGDKYDAGCCTRTVD